MLVSGGAFGIGRAIVLRAARVGASIILADLPAERRGAEATLADGRRLGAGPSVFIGCDVGEGSQVAALVTEGVRACGGRPCCRGPRVGGESAAPHTREPRMC